MGMQETISWRGLSCTLYYELDSVTGRKVLESWTIDSLDDPKEVWRHIWDEAVAEHPNIDGIWCPTLDHMLEMARKDWSHLDPLRD